MPPRALSTTVRDPSQRSFAVLVAAAFALPLLLFLLHGDVGLNLSDEGFLWYGVQRVLAGELPQRDFQSYDIGRYYWSALWMLLIDSRGIVAVRAGNAVLAGCMIALVVVLLRPVRQSLAMGLLAVITFALWAVPLYKMSDAFAAVLLVAALSRPLTEQSERRWGEVGFCLGVAATIGINHALYGVAATVIVALYLRLSTRHPIRARYARAWLAGGIVGFSPVLLLSLLTPGFAAAFVDAIRLLVEAGATNIELPLPRWWAVLADGRLAYRESLFGAAIAAVPLGLLACAWRLHSLAPNYSVRPPAVFVAAASVGVPYLHYAYSRADLVHIAISVLPLLVAAWTFPVERRVALRAAMLAAVAAWSLLATAEDHPSWMVATRQPLVGMVVLGDSLRIEPRAAEQVTLLTRLAETHAKGSRSLYAAPYWPGAYALLNQPAPVWEIYALFPARHHRQLKEIERLRQARTSVAALFVERLDRRPDLGIERTHPAIVAHVRRCMRRIDQPGTSLRDVEIYVSADSSCEAQSAIPEIDPLLGKLSSPPL